MAPRIAISTPPACCLYAEDGARGWSALVELPPAAAVPAAQDDARDWSALVESLAAAAAAAQARAAPPHLHAEVLSCGLMAPGIATTTPLECCPHQDAVGGWSAFSLAGLSAAAAAAAVLPDPPVRALLWGLMAPAIATTTLLEYRPRAGGPKTLYIQ
eukprot:TRINITY_DN2735_c0_g4_i1.p1 TRINITY_DN2735_c0_g4~~TRINITY_DN2735_c0_g4_i1.p1  ORF type:complete len:158 (+),score=23.64 TRINITY_DN2735_c0_g4_i1:320-793(+)